MCELTCLYVCTGGLRLDECTEGIQQLSLALLQASLSPAGYDKVVGCTLTNHFLGELVNGSKVLNRYSYNLRLFLPSKDKSLLTEPWGYTFFGHHLCIAVAFCGRTMVIGPTFMGAEPDRIDTGPHAGMRLFHQEERLALNLMRDLTSENQEKARLCAGMTPKEGLAEDRWNPFDERHLGGARQDNRVVPYGEKMCGDGINEAATDLAIFSCPQRDALYQTSLQNSVSRSMPSYKLSTFIFLKDRSNVAWTSFDRMSIRRTLVGSERTAWAILTTIVFTLPSPSAR